MIEVVGYLASAIVLFSVLMKDVLHLRLFNIAGCFWFIVYGILICSLPIIITNTLILLINFYRISEHIKENKK